MKTVICFCVHIFLSSSSAYINKYSKSAYFVNSVIARTLLRVGKTSKCLNRIKPDHVKNYLLIILIKT